MNSLLLPLQSDCRRHATISGCGRYRYQLWRKWGCGSPLLFIMLNPSTADGHVDDATIRRCVKFAHAHGFGELEVVNLYAYRATDPAELRRVADPVGPENDEHIREAAERAAAVCCAWGARPDALERVQQVMPILFGLGVEPQCLRITRSGYPQHPLYLPGDCRLQPFSLQEAA